MIDVIVKVALVWRGVMEAGGRGGGGTWWSCLAPCA